MTALQFVAAVLALTVMLIGVLGIVLPVLPDLPLIWLAALGYGLLAGFNGWIGGLAMGALTVMTLLGLLIDLALGHAVAKQSGTSWQAIAASVVLGFVGLFFYPPIGPIAGALLGLFLVELWMRRNARQAWTAVKSYALGSGLSVILKTALAVMMIGVWLVWLLIALRFAPVAG
jgi:uncharacterized protein YqgC (DUF456 family)